MNGHEREFSPEPSIPLHVHTYYTLLGAVSSPEALVRTAKRYGYPAVAITDTENFFGLGRFFTACNKYGVKPVPGVELPLSLGLQGITNATFLAQDNDGLLDLFFWVSKFKQDGRMIEIDDIQKRKGRVAVLVRGPFEVIREALSLDNFFWAIDQPSREQLNLAIEIENQTGKTIVAHDVRMAELGEASVFQIISQLNKIQPHPIKAPLNHVLKRGLEIWAYYQKFSAALARTREIAQDTHVTAPETPKLRAKIVPENVDSQTYLEYLVWGKLAQVPGGEKLINRLQTELSLIKQFAFADYILICYEITKFCKEREIEFLVTGSGNNSLVLSVLGITQVDAQAFMFERFINPGRPDLPDIDIDVPYDRKQEVIGFVLDRYGEATQLGVVKRLRTKGVIKLAEKQQTKLTLEDLQKLVTAQLPYEIATHPSGIIFATNPPQERIEGNSIAQLDKIDAKKNFRLPKIDVLSNVGLTRIQWTRKYLSQEGIEIGKIPQDDPEVLARVFRGETLGIANVESPHLRGLLKIAGLLIKQPKLEYLTQILALARPAAGPRATYFAWVGGETQPIEHPKVNQIIGRTGGTIIFQEQILRLATEVVGLPWQEADKLRKLADGRIAPKEVQELREKFITGAVGSGLSPESAKNIFSQIENFRSYGFVEGHARALAQLTYETAYMAEHYPTYFWAAVVNTAADGKGLYNMQAYINEALRLGVRFSFPPLEDLREYVKLQKNTISIGSKLIKKQEDLAQRYSEFLRNLYSGKWERNTAGLVRWQLEKFGIVFTNNPIILIPEGYHFKQEVERAVIIGMPILVSPRADLDLIFVTLDSGRVVDLAIPKPLYERKNYFLDPEAHFWRVSIRVENQKVTATDILAPPVLQ